VVALLEALPDVREDRERRERGVSVADWIAAPRPPQFRAECEGREAGCPALRCKFHLGPVGEAAGYSCLNQIADMPDGDDPMKPRGERTLELIGRVLGGDDRHAAGLLKSGCHKIERADPETLRLLGVRRRHA
jgi:hypothetical protein